MQQNDFNKVDYSIGAETPKKKSVPVIAGICALVLVGASVLSYTFIPQVKNAVRLAVLKPNDYLETVVKDNCESLAKAVSSRYDNNVQANNMADGLAYDYNLSIELKDGIMTDINDYLTENVGEPLPDAFPTKYSISGNINAKNNLSNVDMSLLANDTALLTFNCISDTENEKVYAKVTELSDAYICYTPQDDSDEYSSSGFYDNYMQQIEKFSLNGMNMAEKGISGKDLGDTIVKYSNIIVDNLDGESTIEKNVKGDVLSVEYKYNVVSTTVSEGEFLDIVIKILDEIETDDIIKSIVIDNGGITSEEEYVQLIQDTKQTYNENLSDDTGMATLNTYVNSYGIVCGFELIDMADDDTISLMCALDGDKYALEIMDIDSPLLQVVGTKSQGNALSGTATLNTDDDEFTLSFENVSATQDGYLNGKFSTNLDTELFSTMSIEAIAGDKSQDVNISLDDKILISSNVSLVDAVDVTIPTGTIYDYNTQYEEYLSQNDTETFLQNVIDTLGFREMYDEYMNSLNDYSYDDYDYSYNDDTTIYDDTDDYDDILNSYFEENGVVLYQLSTLDVKLNSEQTTFNGSLTEYVSSLDYYPDLNAYANDYIYVEMVDNRMAYFQVSMGEDGSRPDVDFEVNGIKLGDTYEKINQVFGSKADNDSEYVGLIDKDDYQLTSGFMLEDGVVIGFFWSDGNVVD